MWSNQIYYTLLVNIKYMRGEESNDEVEVMIKMKI